MAGKVFINYRRDDDPGTVGRLFDRLEQELGRDALFMDVEGHIKAGDDYVEVLRSQVEQCDVLLVFIGPRWLAAADEQGRRRLDNPEDWVRVEIAWALEAGRRKKVIPVLIGEAGMPRAEELPDDIKPLARRHAAVVRQLRFKPDAEGLVHEVKHALADIAAVRAAEIEAEQAAAAAEAERLRVEAEAEKATVAEAERLRAEVDAEKAAVVKATRRRAKAPPKAAVAPPAAVEPVAKEASRTDAAASDGTKLTRRERDAEAKLVVLAGSFDAGESVNQDMQSFLESHPEYKDNQEIARIKKIQNNADLVFIITLPAAFILFFTFFIFEIRLIEQSPPVSALMAISAIGLIYIIISFLPIHQRYKITLRVGGALPPAIILMIFAVLAIGSWVLGLLGEAWWIVAQIVDWIVEWVHQATGP